MAQGMTGRTGPWITATRRTRGAGATEAKEGRGGGGGGSRCRNDALPLAAAAGAAAGTFASVLSGGCGVAAAGLRARVPGHVARGRGGRARRQGIL